MYDYFRKANIYDYFRKSKFMYDYFRSNG